MGTRQELQVELRTLLPGKNVYFEPPESLKMVYPCVRYRYSNGYTRFAADRPYNFSNRYELVYITDDATDTTHELIAMHFPLCTLDRVFTQNNLRHFVFSLYY